MRAALMNEFSQAGKNALIVRALEKKAPLNIMWNGLIQV